MSEPPTLKERLTTCLREQAEYKVKVKDLEPRIKALEDSGKDATLLREDKRSAEKGLADENAKELAIMAEMKVDKEREAVRDNELKELFNFPDADKLISDWKEKKEVIHADHAILLELTKGIHGLTGTVSNVVKDLAIIKNQNELMGQDRLHFKYCSNASSVSGSQNSLISQQSKKSIKKFSGYKCSFCDRKQLEVDGKIVLPLTGAHLLKNAEEFGNFEDLSIPNYLTSFDAESPKNFIPLCGLDNMDGTCHGDLDNYRIALMYHPTTGKYHIFCFVEPTNKLLVHMQEVNVNHVIYTRSLCIRARQSYTLYGNLLDKVKKDLFHILLELMCNLSK